jgi:tetratricopeptide (TPR) repeat protein
MPATTPSSSKGPTLSPSELSQLEHAFATDPNSDSYRPLAEAYLGMGRFMEAMVVCKKGVKAHPERADARVLLARVYADQNKDRKAIEELEGAITAVPGDVPALRMAAGLLLKIGENDKGKAYALRALAADTSDVETRELLTKWKIDAPVEAAPPPAAIRMAPTVDELSLDEGELATDPGSLADASRAPIAARPPSNGAPPVSLGTPKRPPAPAAARAPQGLPPGFGQPVPPTQARNVARTPARPVAPQRPQVDLSQFEEADEPVRKSGSNAGMVFLGSVVLGAALLGGYYAYKQHRKSVDGQIATAAHEAKEALGLDSYASYKKACEAAERVLKLDPDSASAHAYLGYSYAVRWGEHGEGESAHQQAIEHLEKARKLKHGDSAFLVAGSALMDFFGKKSDVAEAELQKEVADFEAKGQTNSLLYETLGIIEMRNGDLEKADKHLKKALDLAPAEPRIHAAVADLYRRQGQELKAWNYYDNALRYERDHADAVLGKTLLVLEAARPDYKMVDDLIKRVRDSDPPPSPRQLAMAYVLDGMRLNQLGKNAEGVAQEQKGLSLDSMNPEIHVLVGRRMVHDGQAAQGLQEIKKAIELDPHRASFYVELAHAQMATPNGAKDAIASVNTALKTLPGSAKLLGLLGDAYAKAGDPANAKVNYEKALAVDPTASLPDTRLALAELARKGKDFGRATELYEKAATEYGTNSLKVAETLTDEALLLQDKGEPREKIQAVFTSANKADPNYAPTYVLFARFLSVDKKAKETVKLLASNYLKLDPKGPFAAEAAKLGGTVK